MREVDSRNVVHVVMCIHDALDATWSLSVVQ